MPSYLTNFTIWMNILTIIFFAVVISVALTRVVKDKESNFRDPFLVIFAMAVLGITAGVITGESREPAVSAVIPAVLTFIGGVLIYLVTVKKQTQQKIASIIVISFSITFLVGTFWGAQLRVEFEKYSDSEEILLYEEVILQNVRLQKLKHEKQILDFRLQKGLPIK